jgi:hypothetical protein
MSRIENMLKTDAEQGGVPTSLDLVSFNEDVYGDRLPPVKEEYNPYISDRELQELLSMVDDPIEILAPWLIATGVYVDESAKPHFRTKPDFDYRNALFHARITLGNERLAVRGVPDAWVTQDPRLGTPFKIFKEDSVLNVYHMSDHGATTLVGSSSEVGVLGSTSLKVLAYNSRGDNAERDTSITTNPIQYCPLRCSFCRREYDTLDEMRAGSSRSENTQIANIPPEDMADHLVRNRYKNIDWSSEMQIALVTGTFRDFEGMKRYIQAFGAAMHHLTDGAFDPANNLRQNLHISTHLARNSDQMNQLYGMGVHSIQDTIEIVNNDTRRQHMRKANPEDRRLQAKGELTFEDCLDSVEAGLEVFGPTGYYAALVLGLDNYDDTQRGLHALKDHGLRSLDASIYQPFNKASLNLYSMSAANIIRSYLACRSMFNTTYSWPLPKE